MVAIPKNDIFFFMKIAKNILIQLSASVPKSCEWVLFTFQNTLFKLFFAEIYSKMQSNLNGMS